MPKFNDTTIYGDLTITGTIRGSYTKGDILYASDENTLTRLPIGSNGQVLKLVSGVPAWGTDNNTTYTAGTNIQISGSNAISATDTKYTAGSGLTLTGTAFSLPITTSGTGTFVSSVTQTTNGITVTKSTPPDTTYGMMTNTTLGLGKLFNNTVQSVAANTVSSTASRTYGIQKNSSDQLVVNVPWENTWTPATDTVAGIVSTGTQTFAGNKTFNNNVYFKDEIDVSGSAFFSDEINVDGTAYFNSDIIFNGFAEFTTGTVFYGTNEFNNDIVIGNIDVEIGSGANIRQNKTPTDSTDLVNKAYVDGEINDLVRSDGNVGNEKHVYLGTTSSSSYVNVEFGKTLDGYHAMYLGSDEYLAEIHLPLSLHEGAEVADNKILYNTSVVNKNYVDGSQNLKLLRSRQGTDELTIRTDASVTELGSQLNRGDTIMFEVLHTSTITTGTPKVLTATVGNANSTSHERSITYTTWNGSEQRVYSMSAALVNNQLIFSDANYMRMYKSGSSMFISNGTWMPYIGRVWKVVGV